MSAPGAGPPGWRELATYLAARIVPALASMALTFLCIHALSPQAYGRYSLTLLPASVAAGLIGGLSGQAMLRHAHELTPGALRRGLVGFPLAAAAIACPLVMAYLAWSVGLSFAAFAAVGAVPLVALMDTRRSLFVARARADAVFAMDALRSLAALAIAAGLFQVWHEDIGVPLLAQLLSVALCLWLVRPAVAMPAEPGRRKVDRRYIGYGLWFAGWLAAIGVFSLAERSIVESVSGLAASGRYAAQADVLNAVFSATGGALASSMMPSYLAMTEVPHAPTMTRLLRIGLLGSAATALMCVGVGWALSSLAGSSLPGAGRLTQALTGDPATALTLIAAATVWTAAGFVQKPLELRAQTRLTFASAAVALGLFLAIAPFMGRAFGPVGVAGAKVGAGLLFVAITAVLSRRLK